MAIQRKDGRYIKVIRELTEFSYNSVRVTYFEFLSKSDRDVFFTRRDEIMSFLASGDLKYNEMNIEATVLFKESGVDPKSVSSVDKLPKNVKDLILLSTALAKDLNFIRFHWDKPDIGKATLSSKTVLVGLGFKNEWLTPINPYEINTMNTGVFTNQTFSYECLYRELKRLFKNDVIDC